MGVSTLHASNMKGFAFEFASARPVWIEPSGPMHNFADFCFEHFISMRKTLFPTGDDVASMCEFCNLFCRGRKRPMWIHRILFLLRWRKKEVRDLPKEHICNGSLMSYWCIISFRCKVCSAFIKKVFLVFFWIRFAVSRTVQPFHSVFARRMIKLKDVSATSLKWRIFSPQAEILIGMGGSCLTLPFRVAWRF